MKAEIQDQIAAWNRLDKRTNEIYHRVAAHFGFSDTSFWVLYTLCESTETYTQNSLADAWCYPRQTLNSCIANLVKAGYLYLQQQPGAHRGKAIMLTEAGRELCRRTIQPVLEAERRAFSRMTSKQRSKLLALAELQCSFLQEEIESLACQG